MSTRFLGNFLPSLFLVLLLSLSPSHSVYALAPEVAISIAAGETDSRITALNNAVTQSDSGLSAFIEAMLADEVKVSAGKVFLMKGDKATDSLGRSLPMPIASSIEDVVNNNRIRRELEAAKATIALLSPDLNVRRKAVKDLKDEIDESKLPLLEKAFDAEKDTVLKTQIGQLRALALVTSTDKFKRIDAAKSLGANSNAGIKAILLERLKKDAEQDPDVRIELNRSLVAIDSQLAWGERLGVLFTGASLGSILLLVALGLAITYGLMGVINMAHGEFMMIGAYTTYVVQNLFKTYAPAAFDYYVLLAIPVSFLSAALVGALLERTVIRFLYGRPLETLLATWGISLILMQAVRTVFGAQNVRVENPSWLSGGLEVFSNLTLPYNRIAIIVFSMMVLLGITLLVNKTRLGLFVRGVTQNRTMAACVGVDTSRVDMAAFSLGAGIAGLAGCALSQVGNVGPDLGQSYIVDSFMVVVLGGVGQLAGTVYAALGLGVVNKLLEGWQGAVLAKIMVLVLVVMFIQKRPQGIFALKGRSADA
jgi:urea transport system permease protein